MLVDEALAVAIDYVRAIKKTPIVVNDSRGFFTSRVIGTFVNEALAYRNEVFPTARGDADTARQAARAYAAEKLASSAGDAANFESRRQAYAAAPDITRQRLYLEAVEKSLAGAKKFVMDPTIIPQSTDLWITQPDKAQLLPPMQ